MRITFDPDKDRANQAKHGLSLSLAKRMDWGGLLAKLDSRREYGELRMIGFVPDATGRLFCVVFTDRADGRRIISLRKANLREVKLYAANDQN
ncbi:BrnT family toxin [Thiomonas sp.]